MVTFYWVIGRLNTFPYIHEPVFFQRAVSSHPWPMDSKALENAFKACRKERWRRAINGWAAEAPHPHCCSRTIALLESTEAWKSPQRDTRGTRHLCVGARRILGWSSYYQGHETCLHRGDATRLLTPGHLRASYIMILSFSLRKIEFGLRLFGSQKVAVSGTHFPRCRNCFSASLILDCRKTMHDRCRLMTTCEAFR